MSRRNTSKGRMKAGGPRPPDIETLKLRKDGALVASVRRSGWEKQELVRDTALASAIATYTMNGAVRSETRPTVQPVGYDVPDRITPDRQLSADAELVVGHYTLCVELLPGEGGTHDVPDCIRASAAARQELRDLCRKHDFKVREYGRKQHLDGTWEGGSTQFVVVGTISDDARGDILRMEYIRTLHTWWSAETGASNAYCPLPEAQRRQRMQRKHERAKDLRRQFGVGERGFWQRGDGRKAGSLPGSTLE